MTNNDIANVYLDLSDEQKLYWTKYNGNTMAAVHGDNLNTNDKNEVQDLSDAFNNKTAQNQNDHK